MLTSCLAERFRGFFSCSLTCSIAWLVHQDSEQYPFSAIQKSDSVVSCE